MGIRNSPLSDTLSPSSPAGKTCRTCHDPQSSTSTFLGLGILVQTPLPDPFLQYIFMDLLSMDTLVIHWTGWCWLSPELWGSQFQNSTSTVGGKKVFILYVLNKFSSHSNEFQNQEKFYMKMLLWSIQSPDLREHRMTLLSLPAVFQHATVPAKFTVLC